MFKKDLKIYPPYYDNYLPLLADDLSLDDALSNRIQEIKNFYSSIDEKKWNLKYEEGKWTLAQVVRHIIDAEVIFNNRALRFARNDQNKLAGWNENEYAIVSLQDNLDSKLLIETITTQAELTRLLFLNYNEATLNHMGNASTYDVTVGALGFIIYVHELHHRNVIKNKYLV